MKAVSNIFFQGFVFLNIIIDISWILYQSLIYGLFLLRESSFPQVWIHSMSWDTREKKDNDTFNIRYYVLTQCHLTWKLGCQTVERFSFFYICSNTAFVIQYKLMISRVDDKTMHRNNSSKWSYFEVKYGQNQLQYFTNE